MLPLRNFPGQPTILLSTLALAVSSTSLIWAILSFWWMHWRTGELTVGSPRSYAAHGSNDRQLVLRIPLVFFNTGPTPIVVSDLRLIFEHEDEKRPLAF